MRSPALMPSKSTTTMNRTCTCLTLNYDADLKLLHRNVQETAAPLKTRSKAAAAKSKSVPVKGAVSKTAAAKSATTKAVATKSVATRSADSKVAPSANPTGGAASTKATTSKPKPAVSKSKTVSVPETP